MKKNHIDIVVILSILVLITVFTACDNDNNDKNDPVLCKCDPKTHLGINETCNCGATAGYCDCTLQEYGSITDLDGNIIKIYRVAGITDAQITDANTVANIQNAYDELYDPHKEDFAGKLKEIHIIGADGGVYTYVQAGDKYILGLRLNLSEEVITGRFQRVANGTLATTAAVVQQSARDTVRLTKAPFDAKAFGREVAFQAVGDAHAKLLRVMKQEGATLERA